MKIVLLVALMTLQLAAPTYSQAEGMAKGKAILARAIDAMGGSDRIMAIRTIVQKGDWLAAGSTLALERITNFPEQRAKQTVAYPGDTVTVEIRNGKGTITSSKGSAPLGDDAAKDFLRTILRNPVYLWQNLDQYQVQHASDKEFAGQVTHELLVSGLSTCRYFIEMKSFQIVGCQYMIVFPNGSILVEERYSDFRAVDGVTFPFKTVQLGDGKVQITKNFKEIKWEPMAGKADEGNANDHL